LPRCGANPENQRDLQRQAQQQDKRVKRPAVRLPLQIRHLEIGGPDRKEKGDQTMRGKASRRLNENPQAAEKLKNAADGDEESRIWQKWRFPSP